MKIALLIAVAFLAESTLQGPCSAYQQALMPGMNDPFSANFTPNTA